MNCDRCGTPLEIDISKRAGRCDDCRKDDQDRDHDLREAKERWDMASAAFHEAARQLENAAEPYIGGLVRKHYPTAVRLVAYGEMNEDFNYVLRVERIKLADGTVIDELTDTGYIDETFEAMTEDVEEVLGWLIDINPDNYLNETVFEVGVPVS